MMRRIRLWWLRGQGRCSIIRIPITLWDDRLECEVHGKPADKYLWRCEDYSH